MSKQSERVKLWRRHNKERIIAAMGGKCCICGYNKCQSALALHHLDPSQKDIGLGAIRANPRSWIKIVEELRKCVLLCHNCHSEVHESSVKIPENAPSFDETFSDYRKLEEKEELLSLCPVCGKLKSFNLKNCSYECAAKSKYRVDWESLNLEEELKNKTIVQLAEELGCSDGAIHKRLKKMGLK